MVFHLFGGPACSAYYSTQTPPSNAYRLNLLPDNYNTINLPEMLSPELAEMQNKFLLISTAP